MNENQTGKFTIYYHLEIPARAERLNQEPRMVRRTLLTEYSMTRAESVEMFAKFKGLNHREIRTDHLHACWIPRTEWLD